jgi:hypothetical protein
MDAALEAQVLASIAKLSDKKITETHRSFNYRVLLY